MYFVNYNICLHKFQNSCKKYAGDQFIQLRTRFGAHLQKKLVSQYYNPEVVTMSRKMLVIITSTLLVLNTLTCFPLGLGTPQFLKMVNFKTLLPACSPSSHQ